MPSALNGLTVEYLYKQTCYDLRKYIFLFSDELVQQKNTLNLVIWQSSYKVKLMRS